MAPTGRVRVVLVACALVMLVACRDGDAAGTVSSTAATSSSLPSPTTEPGSTVAGEPTGVAGVDDADAFCASWARYSGTLQALSVAAAFGDISTAEVARIEMMAAPELTAAVDGIGASWPTELVSERSVVLGDVVGPFGRRAQKALAQLVASGATEEDLDALAAVWLQALRHRDHEQPVIEVLGVSTALLAVIDAAAQVFDANVTPFVDDPTLVTLSVEAPLTDQYLAEHCPDLASSGVGDAI